MRVDGATAPSAPGAIPPPTPPQQSYQKQSNQEQNHEIPIGIFRGPDQEEAYSYRQIQRIQQSIAMSRSSNSTNWCESSESVSVPETECSNIDKVIIRTRSCANAEDSDRASRALSEVIPSSSIRPLEEFSKLVSEMPKSRSCYEYRRRGGVRHRDAEEALSSLLWQPYECRVPLQSNTAAESGGASGIVSGNSNGRMVHSLVEPRYGESCVSTMRLNVPPAPTPASADDSQVSSVSVNGEVLTNQTNSACVQVHQPRSWTTSAAQTDDVVGVVQLDGEHRLPPPYSTLPPPVHAAHRIGPPPPPPPAPPHPIPVQPHAYPFQPVTLRR